MGKEYSDLTIEEILKESFLDNKEKKYINHILSIRKDDLRDKLGKQRTKDNYYLYEEILDFLEEYDCYETLKDYEESVLDLMKEKVRNHLSKIGLLDIYDEETHPLRKLIGYWGEKKDEKEEIRVEMKLNEARLIYLQLHNYRKKEIEKLK
ncbi:hypothetical protein CMO90_03970 [Candidatus Woesearchaeota archaeon]|jgi:hypothetical protein|nr:hypothetical protein [Candidatus Woesearchaeota archaeon]|tara:strand:- start:330 stop:782 length:453 start_codon:yes stop_codon:yes gene_type:complete